MLTWSRRHLAKPVLILFLALPALVAFLPDGGMSSEQRRLAAPPTAPGSWSTALQYPAQLDAWVNDHFGFRSLLLELNNHVRFVLFRQFPTRQVIAGKDGRIFLAAHQKTSEPYSAIFSALGVIGDPAPLIVGQLNALQAIGSAYGLDLKIAVIPSAPVVHAAQLPDWLAARYHDETLPTLRALQMPELHEAARRNLYFPYREMRAAAAAAMDVFPRTWFHWSGAGPRLVAGEVVSHFWGTDANAGVALKTNLNEVPSDLSHMFPGVTLASAFEQVDFGSSGIDACNGPSCFGEMRPIMEKLYQMSTYRNPKAPRGRLVLITDSFGLPIAPWYARYYKEVIHFSTNLIELLDEAELRQVRALLFRPQEHDDILFLYHDVTIHDGRIEYDTLRLLPTRGASAVAAVR